MRSVNTMHWQWTIGTFILLTAYLTVAIQPAFSTTLHVAEGGKKRLTFPFPCNSTKVTLRHGYKPPFYSSTDQGGNLISSRHAIRIQNQTKSNNCFLHLTIHDVTRHDQGTYILTAYRDGLMLPDYPRIGLRVSYQPGKVSCEPGEIYSRDWIRLQCTAQAGSIRIPGEIVCFQRAEKLPPLTTPEVNDKVLSQIILGRLDVDPVYCCSSTTDQVKGICECKDWRWHPMLNTIINITDPCPNIISPSEDPTSASDHLENTDISTTANSQALTQMVVHRKKFIPNLHDRNLHIGLYVITGLMFIFSIFLFCVLYHHVSTIKNKIGHSKC